MGHLRKVVAGMAFIGVLGVSACSSEVVDDSPPPVEVVEGYGVIQDGEYTLPGVPAQYLQGVNRRMLVPYEGDQAVGTIEIDPHAKLLYWIMEEGVAMRYPISVGRQGRSLTRPTTIRMKREWPGWTPTQNMLRTQPEVYGDFAGGLPGGLANPLGARALYLYQGGRDTYYRIHGTNDLGSIGNSGSAGCIRLFNHDIIDLYERVPNDTRVVIRSLEDSIRIEGEELANRGVELPAVIVDSDVIFASFEDDTNNAQISDDVMDGDIDPDS